MEELFNQLEEELSKQGLFARRIDLDKCIEILHTLKTNYESSMKEADKIISARNEILANADAIAKKTIKDAGKHGEYTVKTGRYIYRDGEESDQLFSSTGESCEEIFDKTKKQIDMIFREVEEYLDSMAELVRKNREELKALKLKLK